MTFKKSKRSIRTRERSLTDAELDRLWDELRVADEADAVAGDVADLPEAVPLPEQGEETVATFIQRTGGAR